MALPHAYRARHPDFGRPSRRKKHEDEEDQEKPDDDGYRSKDGEEGYELASRLLGQFEAVGLHIVDSQTEELKVQGVQALGFFNQPTSVENGH